jgi:eukaryotic-like serine/threonine-protein kinase
MDKLREIHELPPRNPEKCLYEFGPFRIDPQKRLLFEQGMLVPLTPKNFDLLFALLERPGEVVPKEDLMQILWPAIVVEEGNLNRHISALRKILRESPNEHRYIATVPGRGYQFVAEVREVWSENSSPAGQQIQQMEPVRTRAREADDVGSTVPIFEVSPPTRPIRSRLDRRWLWPGIMFVAMASVLAVFGARLLPLRAKPILTSSDYVLISDFSNKTGDPVFDDMLKQAVSVQLAQSPFLNIVSETRVRATLKLMTRPPDTPLTPEVAREVCQRAGGTVYITGTLAKLENSYVLFVNAVDCQTGDTLTEDKATAENKERVLRAVDEISTKIRGKLGESPNALERYDTPLEQATTPSLEALRAFTQGNLARDRKGDAATIPFFQHAIELDPEFAMAYDALGLTYSNLDEPGLADENVTKAYELRGRVSELESLDIAANYRQIVTGELEKADEISELWAQTYTRDPYPHNLLGVNFEFLGQYEKAIGEMSEAIRLEQDGVLLRSDLMEDYVALNHLDEAKRVYQEAVDRRLDHPFLHADRYAVAFLEKDQQEMARQMALATSWPGAEDLLLSIASDTSSFYGKLGQGREYSARAVRSARLASQPETASLWRMNEILREIEFGNSQKFVPEIDLALANAPTRDVKILAALAFARAGKTSQAARMAQELATRYPHNTVVHQYWLPSIRASIELDQGNAAQAIETLGAAVPYELGYPNPQVEIGRFAYPAYLRGLAYLKLDRGSEAATEFQKLLIHQSIVINCPLGALAHIGLARAYGLQGDGAKSRAAYEEFFQLWKDADPSIPALISAKAEYAKLRKLVGN